MTKDEILHAVDRATEPAVMSKREALTWIEELITDLECRCDALGEEIRNGDGDPEVHDGEWPNVN